MNSTRVDPFLISDRELANLVLDQMDAAIVICDKQTNVILANPAARALGAPEPLGKPFDTAFPLRWAPAELQAQVAAGATADPNFSIRPVLEGKNLRGACLLIQAEGTTRELLVNTSPFHGPEQEIVCCIVTLTDVTGLRQTQLELSRQAALLDLSPDAKNIHAPDGTISYWNRGAERMYGWRKQEAVGKKVDALLRTEFSEPADGIQAQLRRTGHWEGELSHYTHSGKRITVYSRQIIQADEQGQPLAILEIDEDISERRRDEQAQQFLIQATNLFSSSLDFQTTLQNIAEIAVPFLADWCAVHILMDDGTVERLAFAHHDPLRRERAAQHPRRYPLDPEARHLVAHVLRTGETEVVNGVTEEMLLETTRDRSRLEFLRELQIRAFVCVPLYARGERMGTVTLAMSDSPREYRPEDVRLAQELSRRAALALDNAELYEQEQRARHQAEENAARIAALQQITASLTAAVTSHQVARVVLEQGAQALEAQGGVVTRLREDRRALELVSAIGYTPDTLVELRGWDMIHVSPLTEVARTGEPLMFETRAQIQAAFPYEVPVRAAYQAWMLMPLIIEENVLGVLDFSFAAARAFDPADVAFARALAQQCAQALERARLFESERLARRAAERAARRSEWLTEASRLLAGSLDYRATLKELAELIVPELADWCGIHILRPDRTAEQFVFTISDTLQGRGIKDWEITRAATAREDAPHGLARVLQTGKSELYHDDSDKLLAPLAEDEPQLEILRASSPSSMLIVPLTTTAGIVGAITLANTESRRHFTDQDLAFAELLAGRAAVAIENAKLYNATQEMNAELEARVSERTYELSEAYEELRALAAQLQTIREEERTDIARELHDELGQALTALKMDVAALMTRLPKRSKALRERAQLMSEQIDATIRTVRRLSSQLRPGMLDDLGLAPSIEWYAAEFQNRTEIEVFLHVPEEELDLTREQATALFRIFQETLTNVARHAQATRVEVELEPSDSALFLRVRDNGRGIDLTRARGKRSLGLVGMRERAEMIHGTLEIQGEAGVGTTVLVRVPLNTG